MKKQRLNYYAQLIRLDKPIGSLLLLWPTLWGLWLASHGQPHAQTLMIFISGVFIMRSLGCAINDIIDRNLDQHVKRTQQRPLAAKKITLTEGLFICLLLTLAALCLALMLNKLTLLLSLIGLLLAICYPFMKRIIQWPQLVLGAAFSWGIPMAFAAETGSVPFKAWLVYCIAITWPIIYDTFYAMADREDDLLIGIKSTAIYFAENDRLYLAFLQSLFLILLIALGFVFNLNPWYYICLFMVALLSLYQQYLIKDREPQQCFQAFLNSNWCGLFIFLGIYLSYLP